MVEDEKFPHTVSKFVQIFFSIILNFKRNERCIALVLIFCFFLCAWKLLRYINVLTFFQIYTDGRYFEGSKYNICPTIVFEIEII